MFLRAAVVSRRERGESEERRTHQTLVRNVGLEVIHCEGVSVEGLCREGVSAAEGGGALEGSREGGFPTTSARRGGFLPLAWL